MSNASDGSRAPGASNEAEDPSAGPPIPSVYSRPGYIGGLDGLRAISVGLVMLAHFGFKSVSPGGLGVTIFFFISGFLITSLLIAENDRTGTIRIPDFYIRRLLRLGPELYLLILVSGVAGFFYGKPTTWTDLNAALLYWTNYLSAFVDTRGDDWSSPLRWRFLWSLAVEEHFYLTFPLLVFCFRKRLRALLFILPGLCVAVLVWRYIAHRMGFTDNYTFVASDCRIDSIAIGCVTAIVFHLYAGRLSRRPWLALAGLLLGLATLLASLVIRDDTFRQTVRYTVQGLALCGIFLGLFFSKVGAGFRGLLEVSALRWLGRRSYGAYLWHSEIVHLAAWFGVYDVAHHSLVDGLAFAAGASVITFAIAEGSFRLTLQPVRALRRRFGSRGDYRAGHA